MVRKRGSPWGLAEAKAQLSEVVLRAQSVPQIIQRRGKPIGVVVGVDLYGESERRATLGSAEHRMSAFLDIAARIRAQGGVELAIPRREPRGSPFGFR